MKALIAKSCIASAALTLIIALLLPQQLTANADVIGYPVFHNYNAPLLLQRYWLLVGCFPLLSFVLFSVLQRGAQPPVSESISDEREPSLLIRIARVLVVGWVLSLGCVALPIFATRHYAVQSVLLTVLYAALVLGKAVILRGLRPLRSFIACVSTVNAIGALLSFAALYGVSRALQVAGQGGAAHSWSWFPWPLLVLGLSGGGVLLGTALRRARGDAAIDRVEQKMVFFVALPVLVFLLQTRLPGAVQKLDLFHAGETVAAAELVAKGYFPWRDLLFIHGIFEDPGRSFIGFSLFEKTVWGAAAGQQILLAPLTWVSAYFLYLGLFPRRRALVLIGGVLLPFVIPPARLTEVTRYLFFPWVALAFLGLLRAPSTFRAVLFAVLLFFETLLIPELTLAVPGFIVALLLFEGRPGRARIGLPRLPQTIRVATVGVLLTLGLAYWLHQHHALRGFIDYFRVFGRGHLFKGSHPIEPGAWDYYLRIAAPIVAFICGAWWYFLALRSRRRLSAEDHLGLALLLLGLAYYQKFLWRADIEHLYLTFLVCAPFLLFMLDKALRVAPSLWSHALLATTIIIAAPDLARVTNDYAQRMSRDMQRVHDIPLGYAQDASELEDTARALKPILEPGPATAKIFDFTNQPALYYFLLGAEPSTPFFHISMAISRESQALLIRALAAAQPSYVSYYSETELWHWDDVPNSVRHRDVSEYLLRNYEPLAPLGKQLILRKRGAAGLPAIEPRSAYVDVWPCDWGFVPHFDGTPPEKLRGFASLSLRTELETEPTHRLRTLLEPAGGDVAALRGASYLALSFADLKADLFTLTDDGAAAPNKPAAISFRSLSDGNRTYYIQVGACPQWHGFAGRQLILRTAVDHQLRGARLLVRE